MFVLSSSVTPNLWAELNKLPLLLSNITHSKRWTVSLCMTSHFDFLFQQKILKNMESFSEILFVSLFVFYLQRWQKESLSSVPGFSLFIKTSFFSYSTSRGRKILHVSFLSLFVFLFQTFGESSDGHWGQNWTEQSAEWTQNSNSRDFRQTSWERVWFYRQTAYSWLFDHSDLSTPLHAGIPLWQGQLPHSSGEMLPRHITSCWAAETTWGLRWLMRLFLSVMSARWGDRWGESRSNPHEKSNRNRETMI